MTKILNAASTLLDFAESQKSFIFLYPLLQLPTTLVKPESTYMYINGEGVQIFDEHLLYCIYASSKLTAESRSIIENNKYFSYSFQEDAFEMMVFDLFEMPKTYDSVKKGEYSKLSANAKIILHSANNPLAAIALNPELYYDELSEQFDTVIEKGVELVQPPNLETETYNIKNKDVLNQIKNKVGL